MPIEHQFLHPIIGYSATVITAKMRTNSHEHIMYNMITTQQEHQMFVCQSTDFIHFWPMSCLVTYKSVVSSQN
jgi:hypothetical protein